MRSSCDKEVWRRVMQPPQTAPDEDTLLRWLADEYAAAMTYRRLAARGGATAQRLWRMSHDEARHARRLSAAPDLLHLYGIVDVHRIPPLRIRAILCRSGGKIAHSTQKPAPGLALHGFCSQFLQFKSVRAANTCSARHP